MCEAPYYLLNTTVLVLMVTSNIFKFTPVTIELYLGGELKEYRLVQE